MNLISAGKKIVPLLFLCMMATAAQAQDGDVPITREEIVAKAWKAMFGERSRDSIHSLYVEGYFHGSAAPNRQTVRRPNLFRNETGSGVLVFDGKRAAWASRTPDEKGNPRGPELIEAKYWRHFEVDVALLFPAFFDHPAELQGIEKVAGADAYRLYVPLPLGSHVTYFVDCQSFLVTRRLVSWDGNGELWENLVDGYASHDGIYFPDGYSFNGREGREKGLYRNVRFNVEAPDELFRIPDELP